jgi:acetyl-CoA carboxylase carboxyl transferase subunit alpha
VVPEPPGGAHENPDVAAALLGESLGIALDEVKKRDPEARRRERSEKFRRMGIFLE